MTEKEVYLFDVYDDGKLIGTGTAAEVANKIGIHRNTFYRYAKEGRLLNGRYLIRYSGTAMVKVKGRGKRPPRPLPPKPKSKLELTLEDMLINLKTYGNAYTTLKEEDYKQFLKENGIKYDRRHESDKKGIGYVLEVRNETARQRKSI